MQTNKIYKADVTEFPDLIPDEFIQTIATSPPYFLLRDYGLKPTKWPAVSYKLFEYLPAVEIPAMECCLGAEPTPQAYIGHMVYIFRLYKPKLRKDGTIWINIGDNYAREIGDADSKSHNVYINSERNTQKRMNKIPKGCGLKVKDLVGTPWMLAFALRQDGWYLRSDTIWNKPNCMPESVLDRPVKSKEYIFLLSKSKKYYFDQDAILEPISDSTANDYRYISDDYTQKRPDRDYPGGMASQGSGMLAPARKGKGNRKTFRGGGTYVDGQMVDNQANLPNAIPGNQENETGMRLKRDVWTVALKPYKGDHRATFPAELIEPCVLAGCPEGGVVCDIFAGTGTTAEVSAKHRRLFIGCEISDKCIDELIPERLDGLQAQLLSVPATVPKAPRTSGAARREKPVEVEQDTKLFIYDDSDQHQ